MPDLLIALSLLLYPAASADAQVSVQLGFPGVSIGINLPAYPDLVRVPGFPVYYAPRADANYFFYDGLYWVFWEDAWYSSAWYNGPWQSVDYVSVPSIRSQHYRYQPREPVTRQHDSYTAPPSGARRDDRMAPPPRDGGRQHSAPPQSQGQERRRDDHRRDRR